MVHTYENVDTGEVFTFDEALALADAVEVANSAAQPPNPPERSLEESIKLLDIHVTSAAKIVIDTTARSYSAETYSCVAEAAARTPSQFVVQSAVIRHTRMNALTCRLLVVRVVLLLVLPFLMAGFAQLSWTWSCDVTKAVVPVTFQTLAAMLNGVMLGRTYGPVATALYVLYIALGLQGGAAGKALTVWKAGGLGYTGGYVLGAMARVCTVVQVGSHVIPHAGFVLLTLCVGHATARGDGRFRLHRAMCGVHSRGGCTYVWPSASSMSLLRFLAWTLAGHVAMYTLGILWLQSTLSFDTATGLKQGLVCFIPGDVVKIGIAVACTPILWRISASVLQWWRGRTVPAGLRTPVPE